MLSGDLRGLHCRHNQQRRPEACDRTHSPSIPLPSFCFLFFVVVCLFKIGHSTLLMKLLQQIKTWLHVSQYRVNYWNLSILSDFFGLLCHKQSDELRTSTSACYGWFKTHKRLTVFFFFSSSFCFVFWSDNAEQYANFRGRSPSQANKYTNTWLVGSWNVLGISRRIVNTHLNIELGVNYCDVLISVLWWMCQNGRTGEW